MTLLIPTRPELDQLRAGKLTAILRPMEPQPHHCRMPGDTEPDWVWFPRGPENTGTHPPVPMDRIPPPFAPGDVIVWGEEWWEDAYGHKYLQRNSGITVGSGKTDHPAATMPESIARYWNTVAECRPVRLDDLTSEETVKLGFVATLCLDWTPNYPDHPFASSWAWWIDLKGKDL